MAVGSGRTGGASTLLAQPLAKLERESEGHGHADHDDGGGRPVVGGVPRDLQLGVEARGVGVVLRPPVGLEQRQLGVAEQVLDGLGVAGVQLLGVAKGSTRKPGLEQLFLPGQDAPLILPADSPALHLIQQIRDEAHRFAIAAHRGQRGKARSTSMLDEIEGLGPKRRKALLKAFGGPKQVSRAGVTDLARVEGISAALAQRIYDHFHDTA